MKTEIYLLHRMTRGRVFDEIQENYMGSTENAHNNLPIYAIDFVVKKWDSEDMNVINLFELIYGETPRNTYRRFEIAVILAYILELEKALSPLICAKLIENTNNIDPIAHLHLVQGTLKEVKDAMIALPLNTKNVYYKIDTEEE